MSFYLKLNQNLESYVKIKIMSSIQNLVEENKEYELVIGKSFLNASTASYHLLKCK